MIYRVNDQAMERARGEAEAIVRDKNNNAVRRAETEASAKIRSKAEAERGKRERPEAEERAKS